MKYRAARKVGWIWTRAGWKRVPLRIRRVMKVPMPSKHRTHKLIMVMKPAEPKAKKTRLRQGSGGQAKPASEAPEMAAGQGRAVSAPAEPPMSDELRRGLFAVDGRASFARDLTCRAAETAPWRGCPSSLSLARRIFTKPINELMRL
jgi:hypothetical protein